MLNSPPTPKFSSISYEPFQASFTGLLTSFKTTDGKAWTLAKPHLRVTRGQRFMLRMDADTRSCRLVQIVMPDWREHA